MRRRGLSCACFGFRHIGWNGVIRMGRVRPLHLGVCGILIWFLADAATVRQSMTEALQLCAGSVIPALFPFLVVSGLLISMGFGNALAPLLSGLMERLFHLPGTAGAALLLGLAGGYPIGAKTAAELYRGGQLTEGEAHRLLTFCNNANPAFFLGVLGAGVFGSQRTGLYLWLIHILAALLTGLLFRKSGERPARRGVHREIPCRRTPFPQLWVEAVKGGLSAILSVCAFVVIFYVLTRPLLALPGLWGTLAVGLTELFSITPLLTPDAAGFILAAGLSGWGSLSVLCQTAALLEGSGLSIAPCVKGKAVQGLLSAALAGGLVLLGWV